MPIKVFRYCSWFRTLTVVLLTTVVSVATARDNGLQKKVLTNRFSDNWEISFGLEGLSFRSGNEAGNGLSKNLFSSTRGSFGAAASVGKWFTPEVAFRTKASGYWGRALTVDGTDYAAVKFFSLQEQAMFSLSNIIGGYNPARRWDVSPYCGFGVVRNCSYNETSIGAGFGMVGSYRIGTHIKVHLDLGLTYAGDNNKRPDVGSVMGKYRWYSAEIGLTFRLGKRHWKRYTDLGGTLDGQDYAGEAVNAKTGMYYRKVVDDYIIPEGMVLIERGHLKMGMEDSLSGGNAPMGDVSIDDFLMDRTEVTNSQYRSFVNDVVDSIVSERMKDPEYGGNREQALGSLYVTNPVTGEKTLDARQVTYRYETYDYTEAVKARYREDGMWISKDTAYIDKDGRVVNRTIRRPKTGDWDFLNTYIIYILPDTACWVNDFPNSSNVVYARYYFSHPGYGDYPVVGVTWEQANAYCAWRTQRMKRILGAAYGDEQPFRLPTEAEWEYAARGREGGTFPWGNDAVKGAAFANYMPDVGDFTRDGNIITSKVGVYPPNGNGLYDMAGNVAEWTSTCYTVSGNRLMNTVNPELVYKADKEDPDIMKKKTIKGGSWKDAESRIRSAWRSSEVQDKARAYIGFRCVRSIASKPSRKAGMVLIYE